MKKSLLLSTVLLLGITVSFANTSDKITKENIHLKSEAEINTRVETLKSRITEIRDTDLSSLERSERKEIKKELKEIKKELKTAGSTVTISLGAAIIILLLLIILL